MRKQSKGSKHIKTVNLSSLDGVYDVSLGHKASSDRPEENYAKSEHERRHDEQGSYDDVIARRQRFGF